MDNVVNLDERRPPEFEGTPPVICPCGSWWFELKCDHPRVPAHGAITLARNGSITGYAGIPHCVACGKVWGYGT
jgi:hypothetical protein